MAREHLARNLRIARLIRSEQSDAGEAEEKEKSAKSGEQKKLAEAVLVETHGVSVMQAATSGVAEAKVVAPARY